MAWRSWSVAYCCLSGVDVLFFWNLLLEVGLSIGVDRNFHSLREGRKFFKKDGVESGGMPGERRQGRGKISLLGNKWLWVALS
ncbi:hypothetical protein [Bartonella raoultii]|uniref:hypothetical protein n=1 Tax=Bartonella raoultii TaxID=1457020 RepID=UPI001ABB0D38|nr:hypothetical protein [Bartonella raoultii]